MAYSVGDTVVYPHHGAAVIEKTEERELSGETREYFVLRLTYGDLTLMVPADSCEEVGIRDVVTKKQVEQVLEVLRTPEGKAPRNWQAPFIYTYFAQVDAILSGRVRICRCGRRGPHGGRRPQRHLLRCDPRFPGARGNRLSLARVGPLSAP